MYEHWTYRDYLRDVVRALATAWWRMRLLAPDLRRGAAALGLCLLCLIAPLLIPLAPIAALIVRASDRRDARERAKARAAARQRVHQYGRGNDDGR